MTHHSGISALLQQGNEALGQNINSWQKRKRASVTISAYYPHQQPFSHLGALPRLTQDVCGKALLQTLGVHLPLAHDGAGVIDLHAVEKTSNNRIG